MWFYSYTIWTIVCHSFSLCLTSTHYNRRPSLKYGESVRTTASIKPIFPLINVSFQWNHPCETIPFTFTFVFTAGSIDPSALSCILIPLPCFSISYQFLHADNADIDFVYSFQKQEGESIEILTRTSFTHPPVQVWYITCFFIVCFCSEFMPNQ